MKNNTTNFSTFTQPSSMPMEHECCWICLSSQPATDLFQPCKCNSWVHRKCLHTWRYKGAHARSMTHCPNCATPYRVVPTYIPGTHIDTQRMYRQEIWKLWASIVVGFGALIGFIAGVSYLLDDTNKEVPVLMRYAMSSVLHGVPDSVEIETWRSDFHKKEIRVWPYYGILGLVVTSCIVLIANACCGISDGDHQRSVSSPLRTNYRYSTCPDCYCYNTDCYCCCDGPSYHHHHTHNNCGACCGDCCSGSNCNCSDCKGGGGGGSGDNPVVAILAVLLIVVMLVVVVSAVWVVVGYGIKKMNNGYGAYSMKLLAYSQERSGETTVLGRDELPPQACPASLV
eukprot:PhF_6_TR19294/c0_g1_i1/m.28365